MRAAAAGVIQYIQFCLVDTHGEAMRRLPSHSPLCDEMLQLPPSAANHHDDDSHLNPITDFDRCCAET